MNPTVNMKLEGEMGRRVRANVEQWLLTTPEANPGLLELFRLRDRSDPYPNPVPWAGEFFGKYLISAVEALRMTGDPRLMQLLRELVPEFIAAQAEDGYMGPYRKDQRLLIGWDLWGHYHCMLGLYKWYQATGDRAALAAAIKAADLICATFLGGQRRVYDVGSLEMNMGIIHVLGLLHRETGNPRYLALMRQIEEDWPRPESGDYLNQALAGVDFYMTPKPRWESLPILQGLGELYRITGDERYKKALLHDWHSIVLSDVHNCGSFSAGEQATGNPFSDMAIETCCTVAWIALSIDALKLSREVRIADELELATWNAMLGAQHPSGRWWTYNTPMNGRREASAHTIVFQARAGTPELNCCSVNGPRSLGMITEWAVLADEKGFDLNYYGPGVETFNNAGTTWTLTQQTAYPVEGHVAITVQPSQPAATQIRLRIPAWSGQTTVKVNGQPQVGVTAGAYYTIDRTWQAGDRIELDLDMTTRLLRADEHQQFGVSLLRGPLLMTFDQKYNAMDPAEMPTLDARHLEFTTRTVEGRFPPQLLITLKSSGGLPVNLCDYASAGAYGTSYRSWLPVENAPPATVLLRAPYNTATVNAGRIEFNWGEAGPGSTCKLTIALDAAMKKVVFTRDGLTTIMLTVDDLTTASGEKGGDKNVTLFWQVEARNAIGSGPSVNGPWRFTVDPTRKAGPDGLLIKTALAGKPDPEMGKLIDAVNLKPAAGRLGRENGALAFEGSRLLLRPAFMPQRHYTALCWVKPVYTDPKSPDAHLIVSAWRFPMDDPLRIALIGDRLVPSIENHRGYMMKGVSVPSGEWVHVALVKDGPRLMFYVNGEARETITVPETLITHAEDLGLGVNPHFAIGQNFTGSISDFALYDAAFTPEQIKAACGPRPEAGKQ